jgi:hypothetical protein
MITKIGPLFFVTPPARIESKRLFLQELGILGWGFLVFPSSRADPFSERFGVESPLFFNLERLDRQSKAATHNPFHFAYDLSRQSRPIGHRGSATALVGKAPDFFVNQ